MALKFDHVLIDEARHSELGLERLIAAVWPSAFRLAFSIIRDRGLAEDAAQEACAAIARTLPSLLDSRAFAAWSYRIVTNHALTAARRRTHAQTLEAADREVSFERSDSLDLYNAMAKLPHAQRAAVVLHYYAGLNSREIADATGLPPSTIRFHLMLARKTLRKALSGSFDISQPVTEVSSHVR